MVSISFVFSILSIASLLGSAIAAPTAVDSASLDADLEDIELHKRGSYAGVYKNNVYKNGRRVAPPRAPHAAERHSFFDDHEHPKFDGNHGT